MAKLCSAFLVATLVVMTCASVLAADARSLIILYSGDNRGYVLPCAT